MSSAKNGAPVSRMRCGRCGLAYSAAAIAREVTLATGIRCRRCGGTLTTETADRESVPRQRILAVRSPIAGSRRLESG
jgi:ribosomal protein S27AE